MCKCGKSGCPILTTNMCICEQESMNLANSDVTPHIQVVRTRTSTSDDLERVIKFLTFMDGVFMKNA